MVTVIDMNVIFPFKSYPNFGISCVRLQKRMAGIAGEYLWVFESSWHCYEEAGQSE